MRSMRVMLENAVCTGPTSRQPRIIDASSAPMPSEDSITSQALAATVPRMPSVLTR